jgi:hypothetical protein
VGCILLRNGTRRIDHPRHRRYASLHAKGSASCVRSRCVNNHGGRLDTKHGHVVYVQLLANSIQKLRQSVLREAVVYA